MSERIDLGAENPAWDRAHLSDRAPRSGREGEMTDSMVRFFTKKPGRVLGRRVTTDEMIQTAHGPIPAVEGDWVLCDWKTGDEWPIRYKILTERYDIEPDSEDEALRTYYEIGQMKAGTHGVYHQSDISTKREGE